MLRARRAEGYIRLMDRAKQSLCVGFAAWLAFAPAAWAQEPDVSAEPEAPATSETAEEDPTLIPPTEAPPPIYDAQLLRLSEILGSLSFLRTLCGEPDGPSWRDEMASLLAAEHPGPERRSRLVARFNRGFEAFNAVYRSCTPSARQAISRYLAEGETLSADVRSRYSQ